MGKRRYQKCADHLRQISRRGNRKASYKMSCYDYAARINFNEGNFKRQIVKGRVSFRILTLRIIMSMHGHLIGA